MSNWDADNQRWVRGTPGPARPGPEPPDDVVTNPQRTLILALIGVVLCAALGVGIFLLVRNGGDESPQLGPPPTGTALVTPSTDPASPTSGPTSEPTAPTPSPSEQVPAGFTRVQDPAGFTVDVRDTWQRSTEGASVFFTSPDGSQLLQIFQLNGPEPTPVDSAQEAERLASALDDYVPVTLVRIGQETDADAFLEYTYTHSTQGPRRILDHRFAAADNAMYAIVAAAPVDERTTQSEVQQAALKSFCPTAYCNAS